MSVGITCGSCGRSNPLGRLYCMACGSKLEVTEKSVAQSGQTEARLALLGRGVRLLLTLSLLLVLIQLLRPVLPSADVGGRPDANELGRKLTVLQEGLMERRTTSQLLPEAEVNAYVNEILRRSPAGSRNWLGLELKVLQLNLQNDLVVVLLVAEKGPLRLTQEIQAVPVRQGDRWTCETKALRMGHLPLPRALARQLAARSAGVFGGLSREREVLERMAVIQIKDGAIEAATSGP